MSVSTQQRYQSLPCQPQCPGSVTAVSVALFGHLLPRAGDNILTALGPWAIAALPRETCGGFTGPDWDDWYKWEVSDARVLPGLAEACTCRASPCWSSASAPCPPQKSARNSDWPVIQAIDSGRWLGVFGQ